MTEFRQTLRRLATHPAFTLIVVLTLGLGIGVNTAIFSAVHRLILAPMPFQDGDRLAFVWRQAGSGGMMVTPDPDVAHAWLEADEAIDGVALWRSGNATLLETGDALRLGAWRITAGLPALLGVRPLLGRTFTEAEAREKEPVALISESLWRTRFGARRDIEGEALHLDDEVRTIIGVMPDRFGGFDGEDGDDEVWIPLAREDLPGMAGHVGALVRVREDASFEQAGEELDRLAGRVRPEADPSWRYRAVRPQEFLGDDTRSALLVLLGAVTLVLLIACANIAALLLVRLSGRRRDLAVRAALGARRLRLVGSLALELLVLAALGAGAGLLLASWTMDAIHALRPPQVEGLGALTLTPAVLLYAGVLALATTLLFGIGPALVLLRRDMGSPFRAAMGSGERVSESGHARAVLVVSQIALSVALLVGAGLLVRTVVNLRDADLGFQPTGLLRFQVQLPPERYAAEAIPAFVRQATEAVAALPGVTMATDATGTPPDLGVTFGTLHIEGAPEPEPGASSVLNGALVGPSYFRTLGARLAAGRELTEADIGQQVVVVDGHFANQHWPGESALGKRFRLAADAEWKTIVGVTGDLAVNGPGRASRGAVFFPATRAWEHQSFLVRADGGDPAALAGAIRAAISELDPALAVESLATIEERLAAAIATERFLMLLLAAFAALAVLLSALGLYGLIAFALARRTREIGIRLALGAAPGDVRDLLLRHGAALTAAGIGLGLVAALVGARVLEGLLHGVAPRDPLSFAAAALLIAATALLASWLPARKATRVDPMVTLKTE
ncbi:MAG: ADOP family duplicated permease [Gemmatimonadetes bacterium]|nr:ADOP family duplicated permease [Gemmatimonadota bacterium]